MYSDEVGGHLIDDDLDDDMDDFEEVDHVNILSPNMMQPAPPHQ